MRRVPKAELILIGIGLSFCFFQNCADPNITTTTNQACGARTINNCTIPNILSGAQGNGICTTNNPTTTGSCLYLCENGASIEVLNNCPSSSPTPVPTPTPSAQATSNEVDTIEFPSGQ